eukprot:TRINITY_DN474_c0_g2_i1.p3 TRINITY_DN474_c0_g2~~TRINITY_DN474_c0_g2_i1.p3  ORF type:complete len:56 (+),score=2.11 TRINITY_DN474_c0_g2_i1:442-609(+)
MALRSVINAIILLAAFKFAVPYTRSTPVVRSLKGARLLLRLLELPVESDQRRSDL